METPSIKQLMMEFLLELLKEERAKRQAAEQELETLRLVLEPLQQKEMDRIKDKRQAAMENIRKQYYKKKNVIMEVASWCVMEVMLMEAMMRWTRIPESTQNHTKSVLNSEMRIMRITIEDNEDYN